MLSSIVFHIAVIHYTSSAGAFIAEFVNFIVIRQAMCGRKLHKWML